MRCTSWSILFICILMVCLSTFMVFGSSRVHSNENNASSTLYKQDTQSLFPQDQVLKINVNIEESEWEDMVENAIEEEYKIVTVVINEEVYPYVKIRPKGNSSLRT
ncbi:MAG: hypothetical protein PHI40_07800, partial [Caldisericia bacterium]|nr:hypothetical protein [Caldisericia bacterium]